MNFLIADTFTDNGYVSVSTMHLAKGLEFRAVVVMAYSLAGTYRDGRR